MQPRSLPSRLLAIFLLCLTLISCSSSGDSNLQTNTSVKKPSATIGTDGQLISIQSENVRAAGYDEASMVMTVQFENGTLYEYYGVPTNLWTSFIAAQPHPWGQVGFPRLVQGGIPYKRIG